MDIYSLPVSLPSSLLLVLSFLFSSFLSVFLRFYLFNAERECENMSRGGMADGKGEAGSGSLIMGPDPWWLGS